MNKTIKVIIDARMIDEQLHGIARYTYELISRNSIMVEYILLTNDIEKTEKIFKNVDNLQFIKMESKFLSMKEQLELPKILNKYRGEAIFHSPSFVSSPLIKLHTIMTIHDLNHIKFPQFYSWFHKYYYKFIVKTCANKSKTIITVSNFAKNEIVEWLSCNEKKVVVTYNGIDEKFFKYDEKLDSLVKKKYGLPNKYVLYIGNTKPHKNVARLIRAFSKIKEQDVILILNGKPLDEFKNIISSLNLNEKVKFIGFVEEEDLPSIYHQAEVFAFPSLYEGFGLPPLEAIASDCKVVTSNNSALGEIFSNIAVTVNPYNEDSIFNGLEKCLNHNDSCKFDIKKYIKKKFDWNITAKLTLDEYTNLFNKIHD